MNLFYSAIIYALLGDPGMYASWIGLSDLHHEGKFTYVDGELATSSNTRWEYGEPNNVGEEDCAMLNLGHHTHNTVNDSPCHSELYALCEKPLFNC